MVILACLVHLHTLSVTRGRPSRAILLQTIWGAEAKNFALPCSDQWSSRADESNNHSHDWQVGAGQKGSLVQTPPGDAVSLQWHSLHSDRLQSLPSPIWKKG